MSTARPAVEQADETVLHCARHPRVETGLRCGRCETPICPKCMISTPVGMRCPTCAQVKRVVLASKPRELIRATLFGLGAAVVGSVVLGFVPFFGLLGLALLGFLVGRAVSEGANRKRGFELPPLAAACFVIGYLVTPIVRLILGGLPPEIAIAFLPGLLQQPLILLGLALGSLLAWMQNR